MVCTHIFLGRGRLAQSLAPYLKKSLKANFVWVPDARRYLNLIDKTPQPYDTPTRRHRSAHRGASTPTGLVFWLALSDSALDGAVKALREVYPMATIVHFSGSRSLDNVFCMHPPFPLLVNRRGASVGVQPDWASMPLTFEVETRNLVQREPLKSIFSKFFRGPKVYIRAKDKALYHALCVSVSSLPLALYESVSQMGDSIRVPKKHWQALIETSAQNWLHLGQAALNGPMVRKDKKTLSKHVRVLGQNKFLRSVYKLSLSEVSKWR